MILFPKAWSVQVEIAPGKALVISNVDLEFKILRTIRSTANKCDLTIWNLTQAHRVAIEKRNRPLATGKALGVNVKIEAGYVGQTSVLFNGDLRSVGSSRQGVDWRTVIGGDDGGRAIRESRINMQFPRGTPFSLIFKQAAQALGIGLGNAGLVAPGVTVLGIGSNTNSNYSLSGNVKQVFDKLCESVGLTWSIQHGVIQVLPKGTPLQGRAIYLSPTTGLLDSPAPSVDSSVSLGSPQAFAPGAPPKNTKAPKPKSTLVLKCKAMLIPGLAPGRIVQLNSDEYKGNYTICEVEYNGQTWSKRWEADMVLRAYT